MPTAVPDSTRRQPLIISGDHQMAARLVDLAVAAGVEPRQVSNGVAAQPHWDTASVVLIGDDVAESLASGLTQRDDIILVTTDDCSIDNAHRLATTVGADQVASLPAATDWVMARMAWAAVGQTTPPVVAVTGARGGSGASTLATAMALRAAHTGQDTLLVDADRYGGGLDIVLGWERHVGLRWPELAAMPTAFDPDKLKDGLPSQGRLTLLSHTRDARPSVSSERLAGVLTAARQTHDLIVLDLPRPGAFPGPMACDVDLLVVIVPAEIRAVAAARHAIAGFAQLADRVCLVTRKPSPGRLSDEQIAHVVSAPVVTSWNTDSKLAGAMEAVRFAGRIKRGELGAVADAVLSAVTTDRREWAAAS
ncbi:secretion/DNA translocation related CpaE-like protein [Stackebrandtia endophytica]|uniref:Secretion/DNA translocation related CpaE-like protein n=1 Tax=Stackebrandtia endophytica TaxID=1496996 RepID=A0A543AY98_9ACTN|nr:septum site-determining protein Ssd [Stackebrandtia endophytica]TQL77554.1 secretion/DNA translocation related CpaE-like protein [Stackebrandtia endophytica]